MEAPGRVSDPQTTQHPPSACFHFQLSLSWGAQPHPISHPDGTQSGLPEGDLLRWGISPSHCQGAGMQACRLQGSKCPLGRPGSWHSEGWEENVLEPQWEVAIQPCRDKCFWLFMCTSSVLLWCRFHSVNRVSPPEPPAQIPSRVACAYAQAQSRACLGSCLCSWKLGIGFPRGASEKQAEAAVEQVGGPPQLAAVVESVILDGPWGQPALTLC